MANYAKVRLEIAAAHAASRRHSGKGSGSRLPALGFDLAFGGKLQQAGVERGRQRGLVHVARADENELLAPVAPEAMPGLVDARQQVLIVGPVVLWHGRPPVADGLVAHERARLRQLADPLRPRRQPEEALGAHDAGPGFVEEVRAASPARRGRGRDRRSSRCRIRRSRACARGIRAAP